MAPELAVLDFTILKNGSHPDRSRFAQDLRAGLEKHGFVKVVNHEIPLRLIDDVFDQGARLFRLTLEKKLEMSYAPGQPQRGYSGLGRENLNKLFASLHHPDDANNIKLDVKEHWEMGAPTDMKFPTHWPREEDMPRFKSLMEGFYAQCRHAGMRLLAALEQAYHLPEGALTDRCQTSMDELRINHYPGRTVEVLTKENARRVWPHTDLGTLTLLFQDSVGGLEVQDRTRPQGFFSIKCGSRDEMIVNVSETLQRWTNDRLLAGVHCVTLPKEYQDAAPSTIVPTRISIPYFMKADREASVGALLQFVNEGEVAKYSNETALEYQRRRITTAY